ncbi:MAG: exodeoxyribonuclease VII large subunit [Fuerstiella sp.]|nr:exodeoxyribonuclease VII large subunit [Fuerstiella sp.]
MNDLPIVSVTELVSAFKEVVETALPPCCVEAEVSNCRKSPAGHWYLTLKDDGAEIGAVIWRSTASRLKFEPKDGLQVLATGGLQVYVARGNCQFIINRLTPQGFGELELAFRQLKENLAADGLFDEERKRSLPKFPRRIALITSPASAAVRDMIQVIVRRWPAARVVILPVPVQGPGAAARIASALNAVERVPDVDVVITGRGGGSLEDLWAFNEEVVARAIADCIVPVVSAVGHETDISISDLVADRRALTPSEAAELVVPSRAEVRQQISQLAQRMHRSVSGRVEQHRLQLAAIRARSVFRKPMTLIDDRRQRLDELAERAQRAIDLRIERCRQKLTATAASLDALSPLKVLARGYSLTTDVDGRLITSVDGLSDGQLLNTRVAGGYIVSAVRSASSSHVTE